MADDKKTQKKDHLLELLADSERVNSDVQDRAGGIAETARQHRDVTDQLISFVEQVPNDDALSPVVWDKITANVSLQLSTARAARSELVELDYLHATSSATSTGVTVTTQMIESNGLLTWPQQAQGSLALKALADGVAGVFKRQQYLPDVLGLLTKVGVDVSHPLQRTVADHLQQACSTLSRPGSDDGSPAAVLLDIRSAVDVLLDRLIKALPAQERSRGIAAKVVRIGDNSGYLTLAKAHFESLGHDLEHLMNALSGAKGAAMTREQVTEKVNQVLQALKSLLLSVDPSRFRSGGR